MNDPAHQRMPALPRGRTGEHRIEIEAPATLVWGLIEDVGGWSSWNPIYRHAEGSIGLGARLNLLVAIPGMKPRNISVPVTQLVPGRHVQYGSPSLGGLVRATRFVEVSPASATSCVVRNGEVMGGPLGLALSPLVGPKILEALKQMNEGLKAAAEAMWRSDLQG